MIGVITEKRLVRNYQKLANREQPKFYDTSKIVTVGVVLEDETLIDLVAESLTTQFPFFRKDIQFVVYKAYVKNQENHPVCFTEKEIGGDLRLKSDNLKNFVKNNHDLLINFTKDSNLYTNVITLLSNAKFKTGFSEVDDRIFDLIIADPTHNEAVFYKELKKYLTILNKI